MKKEVNNIPEKDENLEKDEDQENINELEKSKENVEEEKDIEQKIEEKSEEKLKEKIEKNSEEKIEEITNENNEENLEEKSEEILDENNKEKEETTKQQKNNIEETDIETNNNSETLINEDKEQPKFSKSEGNPKKNKKTIVACVTVISILIVVMLFSIIFALLNINNTKILNGISILGIDVSDLTIDEARQRINDAINQKFSNEKDNIVLKHGESEVSVNANTFNSKYDVESAVEEAYNIGRSGNIITNNYAILFTKLFKKEIDVKLYYDEELMKTTITDIGSKMKDSVVEYSYYIEGKKLIVVKGKAGYEIKQDELKEKIEAQLENIHTPYEEIEIPVEYKEPSDIDLEKIRNEIYKEPKDAYVEKNPTTVHVEENGVDFGISIEEAKKLLEEDKEEYEIPLKITEAKKKLVDLGEEAFPDLLSTFSTRYDASVTNRAYNVELATKKINGTVIMPGETFSYNKTVGSRTIEAGWKEGTAYISGKVVPSVGGGVCQVSSTLYNTALLANLEITERTNHTFTVDYVSASRDATVYYGSLDFRFKNSRTYPIKIVATAKNGVCKISLYGIKEKVEYQVVIQSKITSYINNTTVYKEDPTLEEGKEVVEQYGFNGCRSEGYKILKLNGKIVSQTLLSKDTYSPQERIVRRGTKK